MTQNYFVIESEIVEASDSEYGADDNHAKTSSVTSSVDHDEPYSCEPIADKDWITEYRQRQVKKEQRLASLNYGLAGRENLRNY